MCGLLTLKLQGQLINYFKAKIKRNCVNNFNFWPWLLVVFVVECKSVNDNTTLHFFYMYISMFMVCSHKCIGYCWKISLKQLRLSVVHRGGWPWPWYSRQVHHYLEYPPGRQYSIVNVFSRLPSSCWLVHNTNVNLSQHGSVFTVPV